MSNASIELATDHRACELSQEYHRSVGPPTGGPPSAPPLWHTHVTSLVLIYVDDVDSVGPDDTHSKYIRDCFNERFTSASGPGVRDVDPQFMLGVYRRAYVSEGARHLELTQPEYIDNLCRQFADHLPR